MTGAALAALWSAVLPAVSAHGHVTPPELTAEHFARIAAGEVVERRGGEDVRFVAAAGLLSVPRAQVWLAITDDQMSEGVRGLTEVALDGAWARPKRLYQRLDLPWPFQDRHWVIDLRGNATLAGLGVWERWWTMAPAALDGARASTDAAGYDAAVSVARNDGAWLLVDAGGDRTFAIYAARVSLGGMVPDGAVDAWTRAQLDGLFAGVARRAAGICPRANASPQPDPAGAPIACGG